MIYTKFGAASIKREIPPYRASEERLELRWSMYEAKPSRFQRLERVKVEISEYNRHAGDLPL